LLILILVLLGFRPALPAADKTDQKRDENKLSRADETFVKEVAEGGMMEVELGKMAATKGTRNQVKAFGRQMEADHGKANEELKAIAGKKRGQPPQRSTRKT
jgi:putative membrane protein